AALRRQSTDIRDLDEILNVAEPAIHSKEPQAALAADLEFHRRLAEISANPILIALLQALSQPTLRARMWSAIHDSGRLEATHLEHRAICNAVAVGDPVSAHAAMQNHLVQAVIDPDDLR